MRSWASPPPYSGLWPSTGGCRDATVSHREHWDVEDWLEALLEQVERIEDLEVVDPDRLAHALDALLLCIECESDDE